MCGLIAIPGAQNAWGLSGALESALTSIAHRGLPGRSAIWCGRSGALGHVRLPIVGLGAEFDQPYRTMDDRVIAYVGEIHNFREHMPGARCDIEVLAGALKGSLEELETFDGFWAFAQADERAESMLVAVDYLAQKPLYHDTVLNVFASELRALVAFRRPTLDETYIANVLKWGYDPTFRTPYRGVRRMRPGEWMSFDRHGAQTAGGTYYPIHPERSTAPELALRDALALSVRRRLVADVPVGLLLSGGLDSTIVASLIPDLPSEITAFHVDNDEARYARLAAREYHLPLEALDLPSDPDAAHRAYGEPIDLGSVEPQHALAHAIKAKGLRVALSGDGADELFGGYRRAAEDDVQASDVWCELPCYHLPRLDALMMSATVELRCPFLAPRVISIALGLPWARRKHKEILRDAFPDLPPEILGRPKQALRAPGQGPRDLEHRRNLVNDFVRRHHEEDAVRG